MSRQVGFLLVLVLGITALLSIGSAAADNAHFTVQPQKDHVINLDLQETDSVSGSFSVVSDDESGITFYVIDPNGNTVIRYENTSQKSFSFTAQAKGSYQLHFDNSYATVYSKTVALNYDITHYIMGMPQEQFLLVVIAAVALIGIIAYVALMPK